MSAPVTIDVLAVAKSIIADPHKRFTVSMLQVMAMCRALVDIAAQDGPVMAPLAVAILKVIRRHDEVTGLVDGAARNQKSDCSDALTDADYRLWLALNDLKTAFEKEFPHV